MYSKKTFQSFFIHSQTKSPQLILWISTSLYRETKTQNSQHGTEKERTKSEDSHFLISKLLQSYSNQCGIGIRIDAQTNEIEVRV